MSQLHRRAREDWGEDDGRAEDAGGILVRWLWRRLGAIEPRPMVTKAMELQTAKEMLAEVLHARPGEVEERWWAAELIGEHSLNGHIPRVKIHIKFR